MSAISVSLYGLGIGECTLIRPASQCLKASQPVYSLRFGSHPALWQATWLTQWATSRCEKTHWCHRANPSKDWEGAMAAITLWIGEVPKKAVEQMEMNGWKRVIAIHYSASFVYRYCTSKEWLGERPMTLPHGRLSCVIRDSQDTHFMTMLARRLLLWLSTCCRYVATQRICLYLSVRSPKYDVRYTRCPRSFLCQVQAPEKPPFQAPSLAWQERFCLATS